MTEKTSAAILGGGNIGIAIARGLASKNRLSKEKIIITRRKAHMLESIAQEGFLTTVDNKKAVEDSQIIIIAVQPRHMKRLLEEISDKLDPAVHVVMSVVTGVSIDEIQKYTGPDVPVVRVMPNTAIAVGESMTCISAKNRDKKLLDLTCSIFDSVGKTFVIDEEQMIPATALCACGIAFFLRAIRAASQGGVEIGFHAEEALPMAAQTAKGAAALLLSFGNHPEREIDKVTTPKGCTISGINEMEHRGFSSAMIKGILTSAEKAAQLNKNNNGE